MREETIPEVTWVTMEDRLIAFRGAHEVIVERNETEPDSAERGLGLKFVFQENLSPQSGHYQRRMTVSATAESGSDKHRAVFADSQSQHGAEFATDAELDLVQVHVEALQVLCIPREEKWTHQRVGRVAGLVAHRSIVLASKRV